MHVVGGVGCGYFACVNGRSAPQKIINVKSMAWYFYLKFSPMCVWLDASSKAGLKIFSVESVVSPYVGQYVV